MKKSRFFIVLGVMLLLFTATAWASQDTPAILASLDQKTVTTLDDVAIAEVRGQAPTYTMVRIFPLNFLDFSRDCEWTWNPLEWRYGNWGGAGYPLNPDYGAPNPFPVDAMDTLFLAHDQSGDNAALLIGLMALPKYPYGVWGPVYQQGTEPDGIDPAHWGYIVQVSRISVLSAGGKFFWGWRPMPLTEYARRQAVTAMGILSLLP